MNFDEEYFNQAFKDSELYRSRYISNADIYDEIYRNDVHPCKSIIRRIRLHTDRQICWGASDCLTTPTRLCREGKHETCETHTMTCFACEDDTATD